MPPWAGIYLRAWNALRHDRGYPAPGYPGRIYYRSISAYAHDSGLQGDDFVEFVHFLTVLDEEFLAVTAENMKAENRA
jgi:hypothetical protein